MDTTRLNLFVRFEFNFWKILISRDFVRKMLRYVPVVGWSWAMSDIVFLARDWEKDRLQLADGVKQVISVLT